MLSKNDLKTLRKLHKKKYRVELAQFVAEGPKVITDLLRTGLQPYRIWTTVPQNFPQEVVVTAAELQSISLLETPNQAVAIFTKPTFSWPAAFNRVLVLDGIRDPGNMGTLIRLADWFGLDAIFCSADCVDVWNPKAVQSSMGSLGRVPVFEGDLTQFIQRLTTANIPIYGTFLAGISVYHMPKPAQFALVMGSESHGISAALQPLVTQQVHIPQHRNGQAESLNVAMATGIVLGIWGAPNS